MHGAAIMDINSATNRQDKTFFFTSLPNTVTINPKRLIHRNLKLFYVSIKNLKIIIVLQFVFKEIVLYCCVTGKKNGPLEYNTELGLAL